MAPCAGIEDVATVEVDGDSIGGGRAECGESSEAVDGAAFIGEQNEQGHVDGLEDGAGRAAVDGDSISSASGGQPQCGRFEDDAASAVDDFND